jgi:hypothetical protein
MLEAQAQERVPDGGNDGQRRVEGGQGGAADAGLLRVTRERRQIRAGREAPGAAVAGAGGVLKGAV